MKRICIIGGGPAGVMAAIAAAESGEKVTLIERNDMLLKKLLLTGNGRCNYSNENITLDGYNFDESHLFSKILEELDSKWLENFFYENGMLTKKQGDLMYPRSEKAETVRNTLIEILRENNVEILLSKKVVGVKSHIDGNAEKSDNMNIEKAFSLVFDDGTQTECSSIVIATGGKAYPSTGSDGGGYRISRELGHNVTFTYPVLTRLFTSDKDVLELAGVRFKGRVSALIENETVGTQDGEIQFTDKGLSGICVFNLSRFLSKAIEDKIECEIAIDFLPEFSKEEINSFIKSHSKKCSKEDPHSLLSKMTNEKIASLIIKRANINTFDEKAQKEIANLLKDFRVKISDHDSFSNAQITKGGVNIEEVSGDMQSLVSPGVFFAGEVLDVDGICGGFNLHWAFASGYKAGKKAAEE